jgi:hypothetical protein
MALQHQLKDLEKTNLSPPPRRLFTFARAADSPQAIRQIVHRSKTAVTGK